MKPKTPPAQPATHTPGNWIGKNGSSGQGLVYSEATGANVAVCYDQRDTALVAAAPAMLEALRELVIAHDLKMGTGAVKLRAERARDLIARAEVRTP